MVGIIKEGTRKIPAFFAKVTKFGREAVEDLGSRFGMMCVYITNAPFLSTLLLLVVVASYSSS